MCSLLKAVDLKNDMSYMSRSTTASVFCPWTLHLLETDQFSIDIFVKTKTSLAFILYHFDLIP